MPLVGLAVLFTLALRVPFLTQPLLPDEAGMLLIAQSWSEGPYLYGDYFVGRGLLVVAFYALGDLLGGPLGIRLLACLVAALTVAAAGWAGHQVRGRAGAGWAALVAAAYSSTYAFSSEVMNERLLGAALVMASVAFTLAAVRRRGAVLPAVAAGVLATAPLLVVQSYADGFAFAGALLVTSVLVGTLTMRESGRTALGGLLGVGLVALAVTVLLATTWMTGSQLWFQMLGYRVEASLVVDNSTERPMIRLLQLGVLVVLTGVLLVLLAFAAAARRVWREPDLTTVWAGVTAMLVMSTAGIVAGGDYWRDYLLQPLPAFALAAALVAPEAGRPGRAMRAAGVLAAVSAVVAVLVGLYKPVLGSPAEETATGEWLGAAARPDDTAVVLYGKANVLHSAGLRGPYPFMWSLLLRTLDPELDLMVDTLEGPDAPTWVVQWHDLDSWELDSEDRLQHVLDERYTVVGQVCERNVYLLRGETRDVGPPPVCPS